MPGEIINVSKDSFTVATAKENLMIKQLQVEGRRTMMAGDFITGQRIKSGDRLS
jgi:methionyl-tRNA formyltransferase